MQVFTIVSIGVLGAILALTVRQFRPEAGLFIGIATGALVLLLTMAELTGVLDALRALAADYSIPTEYVGVLVKIIGMAYLVQFGAEICRDAGESAIGSRVELGGRVLILSLTLPAAVAAVKAAATLLRETAPCTDSGSARQ